MHCNIAAARWVLGTNLDLPFLQSHLKDINIDLDNIVGYRVTTLLNMFIFINITIITLIDHMSGFTTHHDGGLSKLSVGQRMPN